MLRLKPTLVIHLSQSAYINVLILRIGIVICDVLIVPIVVVGTDCTSLGTLFSTFVHFIKDIELCHTLTTSVYKWKLMAYLYESIKLNWS